jgi:hypothetical protein
VKRSGQYAGLLDEVGDDVMSGIVREWWGRRHEECDGDAGVCKPELS